MSLVSLSPVCAKQQPPCIRIPKLPPRAPSLSTRLAAVENFMTEKVRAALGQAASAKDAGAYEMKVECRKGKVSNEAWLGLGAGNKGKGKGSKNKRARDNDDNAETGKERVERLWAAQVKATTSVSSLSALKQSSLWKGFLGRNALADDNEGNIDEDIQMIVGKQRGLTETCPVLGMVRVMKEGRVGGEGGREGATEERSDSRDQRATHNTLLVLVLVLVHIPRTDHRRPGLDGHDPDVHPTVQSHYLQGRRGPFAQRQVVGEVPVCGVRGELHQKEHRHQREDHERDQSDQEEGGSQAEARASCDEPARGRLRRRGGGLGQADRQPMHF